MDLPLELLTIICASLTKAELKVLRLTCKACDRAVVPLLFNEVFLSTNRADFEVTELTIRHFGPHIKTVLFSSVHYPAISLADFNKSKREIIRRQCRRYDRWLLDEHLELNYEDYCRIQIEQQSDLETGFSMAHLCLALHRMPKLETLVLLDLKRFESFLLIAPAVPKRGRECWNRAEACPILGCRLTDNEHLEYQLHPQSGFQSSLANTFYFAMLALWSTGSTIKQLVMDTDFPFPGLPDWVFDLTSQRPFLLCDHFQPLVKLRLILHVGHDASRFHCVSGQHIAKTLAAASQLEDLDIDLGVPSYKSVVTFSAVFGGCQFAKLRVCKLEHFESTSDELLRFLQGSTRLKSLEIIWHELTEGSWAVTAEQLRAKFDLTAVRMDELRGGWPAPFPTDYLFSSWGDPVKQSWLREFFFDGGTNPFNTTAIM